MPGVDPLELVLAPPPGVTLRVGAGEAFSLAAGSRASVRGEAVETALIEQAVRRVVWGGDRRRGVARIELEGELAGTTILVRGEGREVTLEVALGPGVEPGSLLDRVVQRLEARGLAVQGVEVR